MITRRNACDKLMKYINQDLRPLAEKNGITVVADNGNINKGWKGLTIERLAGLASNNKKAPNGLGFEVKSVCYHMNNGFWMPRETMAIHMLHPDDSENSFFHSHLWEKLKSLVFCAVSWNGTNNPQSKLLRVSSFDFLEDEQLIYNIMDDYEFIRRKWRTKGFSSLSSSDGQYIQVRTKGTGHGSVSRAFYAKKNLLKEICPPFKHTML